MRRIEDDERKALIFEWQICDVHLLIRCYFKRPSVTLDVAFISNISVKHYFGVFVEVELPASESVTDIVLIFIFIAPNWNSVLSFHQKVDEFVDILG